MHKTTYCTSELNTPEPKQKCNVIYHRTRGGNGMWPLSLRIHKHAEQLQEWELVEPGAASISGGSLLLTGMLLVYLPKNTN